MLCLVSSYLAFRSFVHRNKGGQFLDLVVSDGQ